MKFRKAKTGRIVMWSLNFPICVTFLNWVITISYSYAWVFVYCSWYDLASYFVTFESLHTFRLEFLSGLKNSFAKVFIVYVEIILFDYEVKWLSKCYL